MSTVVMIWLDAFSSKYLDPRKTPFIFKLSRFGCYTTLESTFAFSGVGVSAFTGTRVNTHKVWSDCILRQSSNPPAAFKWLLRLCDKIPDDILSQYAGNIVRRIFRYNPGIPNLIPVELVDFFDTKEEKRLTEEKPLKGITTLFDQLRECEVKYLTTGLYESIFERWIIRKALKALTKDYRFVLLKLGSLDRLGHKYGPESKEVQRKLREVDTIVRQVVERGIESGERVHFVIFSDHGMTPIKGHVDLMNMLERLPVKVRQDYIVFLNSTVASFWFNNERAKELIVEELETIEEGIILDNTKLKELEIDEIGYEYGDLLFALKAGNVFFPDFYRKRKPPKGMHGYAFSTYDKPPFIIYSPDTSYELQPGVKAGLIDVMPTILDLLALPVPATCEGKSLPKR